MLGELVAGGSTALEQITHDKLCCANFITLNLTCAPYSNETGGSVALPVVLIVTRIITSYSYGAERISICV